MFPLLFGFPLRFVGIGRGFWEHRTNVWKLSRTWVGNLCVSQPKGKGANDDVQPTTERRYLVVVLSEFPYLAQKLLAPRPQSQFSIDLSKK